LTSVKWLQAEPQLLQSLTDRVNVEEIPSLSALVSQCAEHVMDTSTAPLADKVYRFSCSKLNMNVQSCLFSACWSQSHIIAYAYSKGS